MELRQTRRERQDDGSQPEIREEVRFAARCHWYIVQLNIRSQLVAR